MATRSGPEADLMWTGSGPEVGRKWTGSGPEVDQKWTGSGLEVTESGLVATVSGPEVSVRSSKTHVLPP